MFGGIKGTKNFLRLFKSEPHMRGIYSKIAKSLSQGRESYVDYKNVNGVETVKVNDRLKGIFKKRKALFRQNVEAHNQFSEMREKARLETKKLADDIDEQIELLWDNYHSDVKTMITDRQRAAQEEAKRIKESYISVSGKDKLDPPMLKKYQQRYKDLTIKLEKNRLTTVEHEELKKIAILLEEHYLFEALKELTIEQKMFLADLDIRLDWLNKLYKTAEREFMEILQRKKQKTIEILVDGEKRTLLFDAASPRQKKMAIEQWMASDEKRKMYYEHMKQIEQRIEELIDEADGTYPMTLDELALTSNYSQSIVNRVRNSGIRKFLKKGPEIEKFTRKKIIDKKVSKILEDGMMGLFEGQDMEVVLYKYFEKDSLREQLFLKKIKPKVPRHVSIERVKSETIRDTLEKAKEIQTKTGKLTENQLKRLDIMFNRWLDETPNVEGALEAYELFGDEVVNIKELQDIVEILSYDYRMSEQDAKKLVYGFFNDIRKGIEGTKEVKKFSLNEALDLDQDPIKRIFDELGINYSPEIQRLQKRMDFSRKFANDDIFMDPIEFSSETISNDKKFVQDRIKEISEELETAEGLKREQLKEELASLELDQETLRTMEDLAHLDDDEKLQVIQDTLRTRKDQRYIQQRGIPQHQKGSKRVFKDGGTKAFAQEQQQIIDDTVKDIVMNRKAKGLKTTKKQRNQIKNTVEQIIGSEKIKVDDTYYVGHKYGYNTENEPVRLRSLKDKTGLFDVYGIERKLNEAVNEALRKHTEAVEILSPTTDTTRLLYPGGLPLDLNHLSDDEIVELVNTIYGSDLETLSDLYGYVDYLDDAVTQDIATSISIHGEEISREEFIRRYGLERHLEEYQAIMEANTGNYVKYKKALRIQDEISNQFDYFQVNKNLVHLSYALNEEFNIVLEELIKGFSGTSKESFFGMLSDVLKDNKEFAALLNDGEHGLTKFLTSLKNAKLSNDLVKEVMSDPLIKKYKNEITPALYDYMQRISNRDYLRINEDGLLTWRSKTSDGKWEDELFRGVVKDMDSIQKAINRQYFVEGTPVEVLQAMDQVYQNIHLQIKRRYRDILDKGIDSDFGNTRLYGEVNANLINDTYNTINELTRILKETKAIQSKYDVTGNYRSIQDIPQIVGETSEGVGESALLMMRHLNEMKDMLGEYRHSLRVVASHNQQLKRFLFTTSGTHVKIDTPQLFDRGDLVRTGSPFTYRQSPYKRSIVKLKKSLNRHIIFRTWDENMSLEKRARIMKKFPRGAVDRHGKAVKPEDVNRVFKRISGQYKKINKKQQKINQLDKKRETSLYKEAQEITDEIMTLEYELDQLKNELDLRFQEFEDMQLDPNIFGDPMSKHSKLAMETATLLDDVDNPETFDIYTFLDILDDFYSKPSMKSKINRGMVYYQDTLVKNDPGLDNRVRDYTTALYTDKFESFDTRIADENIVKAAYGEYKLTYHDGYNQAYSEAAGAALEAKAKFARDYRTRTDRIKELKKITGHYSDEPEGINHLLAKTLKDTPTDDLKKFIKEHAINEIPEERLDRIVEAIKEQRALNLEEVDFTTEAANELRYVFGGAGEWKYQTSNQVELKRLQRELIELRDGKSKAPEHLRAKEQELQTQIRKLKRVEKEGDVVVSFESEWVPSELEELRTELKKKTERKVNRLKTKKEKLWEEHAKRYGGKAKAKFHKPAKKAQDALIKGDFEEFKKVYIKAGGTAEDAEKLFKKGQRILKRFEKSPHQEVIIDKQSVKTRDLKGRERYKTEVTKGVVDLDDATKVSDKDIINYKYEHTNSVKEEIQDNLAKKEFGDEFDKYIAGTDAPPTYQEARDAFLNEHGADLPVVQQQNRLENFYEMTVEDLRMMFKDGQDLYEFLRQHDEYILVATVPDSSVAAKTPTRFRKAFEGEKVHEGTKYLIHGPDHKIEVPFEKVKEGDVVLKDGRFMEFTEIDQIEEAAFLEGHYDTNKPTAKKVLYTAEELDDLLKSESTVASHIGLVTKDNYKTMARISYRDYKLPPVLDYYFKNILRLQKQDMLINQAWHITNMVDVLRKNSQMMEGIWDTKDYVEHLSNAWTYYNTWDAYKKLLISEKMDLHRYLEEAVLTGRIQDATLAQHFIQDLKRKGMVGYVRDNHTTRFNKQNLTNPVFKGQHDPGTIVYRKWKNSKQFKNLSDDQKVRFLNEKVDDFLNLLDEVDFFQTSSATTDLPEFIRKMEQGELYHAMSADRWLFRHLAYENPIMRANMKGGTIIEQVGRLHGYLLDTHMFGTSRNRAVANSLKRHFDYSDRTLPELYATILFPFNAFPTRNALFWAEELEKAANSRRYYHFINALWGSYDNDEHSEYAQYMKSKGYIPIGNHLLKIGDSRSMAMDMGQAGTRTAQNRLNPILRGAVDQLTERERSMANYLPLIRRGPQLAEYAGRLRDEGPSPQTLLPGLFGTIYRDHQFGNPVFRTQRNPYKQLFNQQGQYRQLSNNAYYRVRQIQNEQHRRRRL